jgi:membrane-associated phospholipid phosphatase
VSDVDFKSASVNRTDVLLSARAFDTSIAMPHRGDIVPYQTVLALVFVPLPALSLLISYTRRSLHEFHSALMTLSQGVVLQLIFVESGKLLASRFRPDYLSRCESLDADGKCQNPSHGVMADGAKSFPSGHSASSFFGTLFHHTHSPHPFYTRTHAASCISNLFSMLTEFKQYDFD